MGRDLVGEVLLVLNDARDGQRTVGASSDRNRLGGALVGMDSPEEEQVIARIRMLGEGVHVDAMVNRLGIVKPRMAIRVTDRHIDGGRVVPLVDGHDLLGGESVDGGHDGGVDQAAVREGQEVEAVVNDVEFLGAFVHIGDVDALGDLRIDRLVLRPPGRCSRSEVRRGEGVSRGKRVTSWPRATRPSARIEAKSSHGP